MTQLKGFTPDLAFLSYELVEEIKKELSALRNPIDLNGQINAILQTVETLRYSELLRLHYLGLSHDEIAERLGFQTGNLDRVLVRAKEELGIVITTSKEFNSTFTGIPE